MEIEDYYKLAYQAALGNTHLGTERNMILASLHQELNEIEPDPEIPLIEEISPDRTVVRLNLRAFKSLDGDVAQLAEALLLSARSFSPSLKKLQQYWSEIEQMGYQGEFSYQMSKMSVFFTRQRQLGFPAIHHSSQFRRQYRPAYRVIQPRFLPKISA